MQKSFGIWGIGCFWSETRFSNIKGVISTEVGYCGGNNSKTTYEEVCAGNTGHVEVVKVEFDEKIISYDQLTRLFFELHDPTSLNKQDGNIGYQYRSEVFYLSKDQKKIAEKILNEINNKLNGKVKTTVREAVNYCKAEEYHQKYFQKKSRK